MSYELAVVTWPEDWETYHSIRRVELFEARGRIGIYQPDHVDERAPNHFPLLLKWNGRGRARWMERGFGTDGKNARVMMSISAARLFFTGRRR